MRIQLNKTLLTAMAVLIAMSACKQNNKTHKNKLTTTASHKNVLDAVIDSVNVEINNGEYGLIDRFMVVQNEKLIADFKYKQDYASIAQKYDTTNHQYNYNHPDWHPYYRDTELHTLQSVTKSVTSILLGIALDSLEQYNVSTRVMPLFSDYDLKVTDQRKSLITIEDLLTMRSGLEWNEGNYTDPSDDCIIMEASAQWIPYVLNKPTDTIPGTSFEYNSGASVLLGKIVRIISGQRIDKYAEQKLFGPLGITEYYWKITPEGEVDTEGGLYLKAEDLAKLGALFLNKGKWENQQIVSETWVKASTTPVVSDVNPKNENQVGYGYQWWVPYHTNGEAQIFAGNGFGGQYLMVAPEYDLIVVFNGWNINESVEKSTWHVLQDRILPRLQNPL
ncbi:serine hydrolase domain-containing protein [Eudoraea chungangensis]|uniref:serine hydrolase domain-containing protein n=1 Tax=Eudoraea chungangensis TaxID=1481905 RepID=UPI0023EB0432|nr:serine hydrolase [Eudoraea chungangensis]